MGKSGYLRVLTATLMIGIVATVASPIFYPEATSAAEKKQAQKKKKQTQAKKCETGKTWSKKQKKCVSVPMFPMFGCFPGYYDYNLQECVYD